MYIPILRGHLRSEHQGPTLRLLQVNLTAQGMDAVPWRSSRPSGVTNSISAEVQGLVLPVAAQKLLGLNDAVLPAKAGVAAPCDIYPATARKSVLDAVHAVLQCAPAYNCRACPWVE